MDVVRFARRRPGVALAALPGCTFLFLLWVDEFNLRGFVAPALAEAAVAAQPSSAPSVATAGGVEEQPAGEQAGAQQEQEEQEEQEEAAEQEDGGGAEEPRPQRSPRQLPRPPRPPLRGCKAPPGPDEGLLSAAELRGGEAPKVGLSMALHPPKFHSAGAFLEQYAACPGAIRAMSIFIVFTDADDVVVFREALACHVPSVSDDLWTPVVAKQPVGGWRAPSGSANQIIAAYKKWHGLAYMMDMPTGAPEYGLLVDSELLVFDNAGERDRGEACSEGGPWQQLYWRIRAQDLAKYWPAARVSSTATVYDFGSYKRSGKDYDRSLMQENAAFVTKNKYEQCMEPGCMEVKRQLDLCLFSWWTDLPWAHLEEVGRMWAFLAGKQPGAGGWRALSSLIKWVRFEHVGYQQWTALHSNFTFKDVTNITGEAKWGSYMEDPMPGARLAELRPLWVSGEALERVEQGVLPSMSQETPPLLIFHADKGRPRSGREDNRDRWEVSVLELLRRHNRTDWRKDNIK